MATNHGSTGEVFVASAQVAEITAWSITETAEFADDTALADTATSTNSTAITSWSGEFTCYYDDTDTNGQEALTVGSSPTLHLYPGGDGSGNYDYTGTARITQIVHSVTRGAIQERTFSFEGSGTLTKG